MKRSLFVALAISLANSGCATMNNTESGALTGGVVGGVLGTVVGAACRAPGVGALIGAASGAAIGGVAGHAEDKREERQVQAVQQWQAHNQMTIADVVKMTHDHVDDGIIVNQINTTFSNFDLQPNDITHLQQQGVSNRVIGAMQLRRSPPPGGPYRAPPPGYSPGYVIYDAPPPPVAVGVGIGYGWRRRCW